MRKTHLLARRLAFGLERLEDRHLLAGDMSGELIGVAWDFEDSAVFRIDEISGAAELIGHSGLSRVNSLAQDSRGVLYTAGAIDTGTELVNVLATVDPVSGNAHVVGPLTGLGNDDIRSMAFSPDGVLYAFQRSPNRIVSIDPGTAEVTFVVAPISAEPVGSLQGLEFGPDGVLYAWGSLVGLVQLDLPSGAVIDVDPSSGGGAIQSLAFLEDGTLLGHYDSSRYCPPSPFPCTEEIEGTLVRVDPLTGATSLVGTNIAGDIRGLAIYKIPEVPEIPVQIDVKPGGDPNSINLAGQGLVPITIFSTDAFDAAKVDVSTVVWAGANVAQKNNGSYFSSLEDMDGDGDLDLVVQFRLTETDLLDIYEDLLRDDLSDGTLDSYRQSVDIALEGLTNDGAAFRGSDSVDLFLTGRNLRDFRTQRGI